MSPGNVAIALHRMSVIEMSRGSLLNPAAVRTTQDTVTVPPRLSLQLVLLYVLTKFSEGLALPSDNLI